MYNTLPREEFSQVLHHALLTVKQDYNIDLYRDIRKYYMYAIGQRDEDDIHDLLVLKLQLDYILEDLVS